MSDTYSVNDVFNNPSNDYVNPGLSPCQNISDTNNFGFLNKKKVGIVSGSNIISSLNLSNISIDVNEWISKAQTIQSGEIIYVPGLTKGLLNKSLFFTLPDFGYDSQKFFFNLDLSINYYGNFKVYEKTICASANFELNLDIDDALNLALSNNGVNISSLYDPSAMNFVGNNIGFDFDVYNVVLNIIDASMDENSPFPAIVIDGERLQQSYNLEINSTQTIPAMKYPNGAMLGYIMITNYPEIACIEDSWLYTNNVVSPFDVYYQQDTPTGISDISTNQIITFVPPFIFGDVSINFDIINDVVLTNLSVFPIADVSSIIALPGGNFDSRLFNNLSVLDCSVYVPDSSGSFYQGGEIISNYWDVSTLDASGAIIIEQIFNPSIINYGFLKDVSLLTYNYAIDPSLLDPSMAGPIIQDPSIFNTIKTKINHTKTQEVNIFGQFVALPDVNIIFTETSMGYTYIPDSSSYNYEISDSSIKNTNILSSFVIDTSIQGRLDASTNETDLTNTSTLTNSIVLSSNISNLLITDTYSKKSNLTQSIISSSYFKDDNFINSEIYNSYIYDSSIQNSEITDSLIINNDINDTILLRTATSNSRMTQTTIVSSSISYSELKNLYINYWKLTDSLWVPDASLVRTDINNSNIYDASIFNTNLIDCSIFNSNLQDVSIFGCTLYNSLTLNVDSSNSKNVWINTQIDCSTTWNIDSSSLYEKFSKQVDVGMNAAGDNIILSAGEYLDYINTHGLWEKFGPMSAKFSTVDPLNSNIKNLIGGFYVFNPHEFPVQLEYMLIN